LHARAGIRAGQLRLQPLVDPLGPDVVRAEKLGRAGGETLARGRMNFRRFEYVRLTISGARGLRDLSQTLRQNDAALKRSSTLDALIDLIFDQVLEDCAKLKAESLAAEHLTRLKARFSNRIAALDDPQLHILACCWCQGPRAIRCVPKGDLACCW
jgi:hypothetical protein